MCAVSCAIRFARHSCWFCVAVLSRNRVRRVVEDGAGVLHAAELKRRQEHEVEFLKRVLAIGVGFEPVDRLLMQIENRLAVCRDLRGVGFAVVHVKRAAAAFAAFDRKLSGREAEQIRRKRSRLAEPDRRAIARCLAADLGRVRDRGPCGGNLERERERAFDVGLVETGKRLRGARRHEQRVEKLVVTIQRLVARGEGDVDDVLTARERLCRDDEMTVLGADGNRLAVGRD